jgi:hypothetical protein
MPRQPKLRKKKTASTTYWFTKAGGDTYFGNVEIVSFKEARSLFNDHIKSLSENQEDSKRKGLTASDLVELFLSWIEKNRSKNTYESRRTHCNRFLNFRVGSQKTRIADRISLPPTQVNCLIGPRSRSGRGSGWRRSSHRFEDALHQPADGVTQKAEGRTLLLLAGLNR